MGFILRDFSCIAQGGGRRRVYDPFHSGVAGLLEHSYRSTDVDFHVGQWIIKRENVADLRGKVEDIVLIPKAVC